MKIKQMGKAMVLLTFLLSESATAGKKWFSKDSFITLRKNSSTDSLAVTTLTCSASLYEVENSSKSKNWLKVKSGGVSGYVKRASITKKKGECLSHREKLIFNSLSLSAEEIYFWAKLNEHFISGEVNEVY